MKKLTKTIQIVTIILLLLLSFFLFLTACSKEEKEIPVPTELFIEGDLLSWTGVTGTTTYDVKIDEEIHTVEETSCDLSQFVRDYDPHQVSVRANTYDGTSAFSYELTYQRKEPPTEKTKLSAPYGIEITANKLMWNGVINNNGYKIFYDDKTLKVDKDVTSAVLTFSRDGKINIRMQTLGDDLTYLSSDYSDPLIVTVKDGRAPRMLLNKPIVSFNAQTRSIEWENRYGAAAAAYEVYLNESGTAIATITADASKKVMGYAPNLTPGNHDTFTIRTISMDGLYLPSAYSDPITFPLVDSVPTSLQQAVDSEENCYYLTWSERAYGVGYRVELDGDGYTTVTENRIAVPDGLEEGRHLLRVRTVGDNTYYGDSPYSAELAFFVDAEGNLTVPLYTPVAPDVGYAEEVIKLSFNALPNADRFVICFRSGNRYYSVETKSTEVFLTRTSLNDEPLSSAMQAEVAAIFEALETGLCISLQFYSDSPLYAPSAHSAEVFLSSNPEVNHVASPKGFTYGSAGFSWYEVEKAELYQIEADGDDYAVVSSTVYAGGLTSGLHLARVRVSTENALFSEEKYIRIPLELEPPRSLKITSGVLSFEETVGATSYILYANGERLTTLLAGNNRVNLGEYLVRDGRYVLYLQAIGAQNVIDSPKSEECVYLKTDGAYGTEYKPYEPLSAEELLAIMREHPQDHVSLIPEAEYDFSSCTTDSFALDFSGVLNGNGACLKGIRSTASFFHILSDATLSDLTIELDASIFPYEQNGAFALQMRKTRLVGVTFCLTGAKTSTQNTSFGLLVHETDECDLIDCTLTYDFSFEGSGDLNVGGFAYDFRGNVENCTLQGSLSLRANRLNFGVFSYSGALTIDGLNDGLNCELRGDSFVNVGGLSRNASLEATSLRVTGGRTLTSPLVTYHGLSAGEIVAEDSIVGGSITVTAGSNVSLFGVGGGKISSVNRLKVNTTIRVNAASGSVLVTGFGDVFADDCASEGASFDGSIEVSGDTTDEVQAAGFAQEMHGSHEVAFAGNITISTKGRTRVFGIAKEGDYLNVTVNGSLIVHNATDAEIAGVSDRLTDLILSGALRIQTESCREVKASGAVLSGDIEARIRRFVLSGEIRAESAEVAGLALRSGSVSVKELNMSVNPLVVNGDSFRGAGVIFSADAFTLPNERSELTLNISATGEGTLAGLVLDSETDLGRLQIAGSLSLVGTGYLYGLTERAKSLTDITTELSLHAEGNVTLYGLASVATYVEGITQRNCTISFFSEQGVYGGLIGLIDDGRGEDILLQSVAFSAIAASDSSELALFGMVGRAKRLTNCSIEEVSFDIGSFGSLTFAALAERVTDGLSGCSLSYSFLSRALNGEIGGVLYAATGEWDRVVIGSDQAPLTLEAVGSGFVGGLAVVGENVTVTANSSIDLVASVTVAEGGEMLVGGLFARIESGKSVVIEGEDGDSALDAEIRILRQGGGSAVIGGAVGRDSGSISGAHIQCTLTDSCDDVVGGVVGLISNGSLSNSYAMGEITANGTVGGLFGEGNGGNVNTAFSAMKITVDRGIAGGLFAKGYNHLWMQNLYSVSRMTKIGAGLFGEGESISLHTVYFAGTVKEYTLAKKVGNLQSSKVFLDAALTDLTDVGEGDIEYEIRSFSYGYNDSELNYGWITPGDRYPYLAALGDPLPIVTIAREDRVVRRDLDLAEGDDLYELLSLRTLDVVTPCITWVDSDRHLDIVNGVVSILSDGTGILYGRISGGAIACELHYNATGFEAFEGSGTEADPYLITKLSYFSYIEEDAAGYYRYAIQDDTQRNVRLDTLFSIENPFRGHIDFNHLTLIAPTIGSAGLFAAIEGGSVKNLTIEGGELSGALIAESAHNTEIRDVTFKGEAAGAASMIAQANDCSIRNITFTVNCFEDCDFALIGIMQGGSMQSVSLSLNVSGASEVSAYLIGESASADILSVQALFTTSFANEVAFALTREDVDSVYDEVMLLVEIAGTELPGEIAGFAFDGKGTIYRNSAVLLLGRGIDCYPLLKAEEDVSFLNVKVYADHGKMLASRAGMMMTPESVIEDLQSMPHFVGSGEASIYTPLGYSRFSTRELDEGWIGIILQDDEDPDAANITEETLLENVLTFTEDKYFASILRAPTVIGDCVAVKTTVPSEEGYLFFDRVYSVYPLSVEGETPATLLLTDLFGREYSVSVYVREISGFTQGQGTQADPYVIASFGDFLKIADYEEDNAYYLLNEDIEGVVETPLRFMGHLTGTGSLTVHLACETLFTMLSGEIDGIDITLYAENWVEGEGDQISALLAKNGDSITLKNLSVDVIVTGTIVTNAPCFGLLFGALESGSELRSVSVEIRSIRVEGSCEVFGLIAGRASDTFLYDVEVSGAVEFVGENECYVGAVGILLAGGSNLGGMEKIRSFTEWVASAPVLTIGMVAGESSATIQDVDADGFMTLVGGQVIAGGVIGYAYAPLRDAVVKVDMTANCTSGCFGGLVGESDSEIEDCDVDASMDILTQGECICGGALGFGGSCTIDSLVVSADIRGRSLAEEDAISELKDREGNYVILCAVGGAIGYLYGTANLVSVTVVQVTASAEYEAGDLAVLAGGIAGFLREGEDLEVKGNDAMIYTSGGQSVVGGGVALLAYRMERAVISGLTLVADLKGGVAAVFSLEEEGLMKDVFCVLDLDDAEAALAARVVLEEDSSLVHCAYRKGVAVGTSVSATYLAGVTKNEDIAYFYSSNRYASFGEEWSISGNALPTLL